MSLSYLRSVMVDESKAYGFTIAFWGSGIMLVEYLGIPGVVEALVFGLGAVIGFGLLAVLAFRGEADPGDNQTNLLVFSTVHYVSALAPILITYLIVQFVSSIYAFLLAGMNVSIFYNLLMVIEHRLADEGIRLERKLENLLG